jgi:hypothetical protein
MLHGLQAVTAHHSRTKGDTFKQLWGGAHAVLAYSQSKFAATYGVFGPFGPFAVQSMPCCISDTVAPILSGRRSSVMQTTAVATSRRKGKAQRTACRCAAVGEASVNGSSHSAGKEVRLVGHCVDNVTQCACPAGQAGSVTVLVLHSVNECHSGTRVT